MRDQVAHDPDAQRITRAFAQPQRVRESAKALVTAAHAQTREAVVHPERGVGFDGEALLTQDQHGATLVTAFGLATSTLDGSDCRLARLFDEVAHDGEYLC